MIQITSLNQLLLDGNDLGAVFDAVANNPLPMADVQRAMMAYVESVTSGHAKEVEKLQAEIEALKNPVTPAEPLPPAPPMPLQISKLSIRRKLRELGMEPLLDGFLASDPETAKDWADSSYIVMDDPMLVKAIPTFATTAGISEAEVVELLQSCQ